MSHFCLLSTIKPHSRLQLETLEVNASFRFKLASVSESLQRALIGSVQDHFVSIRVHLLIRRVFNGLIWHNVAVMGQGGSLVREPSD